HSGTDVRAGRRFRGAEYRTSQTVNCDRRNQPCACCGGTVDKMGPAAPGAGSWCRLCDAPRSVRSTRPGHVPYLHLLPVLMDAKVFDAQSRSITTWTIAPCPSPTGAAKARFAAKRPSSDRLGCRVLSSDPRVGRSTISVRAID